VQGFDTFQLDPRVANNLRGKERYKVQLFLQPFNLTDCANFGNNYGDTPNIAEFVKPLGFMNPSSVTIPRAFSGEFCFSFPRPGATLPFGQLAYTTRHDRTLTLPSRSNLLYFFASSTLFPSSNTGSLLDFTPGMPRRPSSQKLSKKLRSGRHRPLAKAHVSFVNAYLQQLGEKIRIVRARRGFTLDQLARQSRLSGRFLAKVELGRANISIARLHEIADALDIPIESLVADGRPASSAFDQSAAFLKKLPPSQQRDAHKLLLEKFAAADSGSRRSRIALIGLRGAGKSTLGSVLAQRLGVPFIELDKEIERDSGLTLTIIFDLYGIAGYRRMEREALSAVLAKYPRFVLAPGGGIISDPGTYNRLLSDCFTIFLRAKPEEHMARVLKQGDRRTIAQSSQAMRDLRRILWSREALYRQADATLETTGQTVSESLHALIRFTQV